MNETQTFEKINKPLIKGHPEFKSAEESKAWQRDLSQKAKTSEHAMIVLSDIENTREAKSFLDGDRRCFFPKATTESIDYDKIKFKFSKAKYKTELLQFYKDGILIKIPSIKKPSYVDIALLHRTFDSDIDHMMTSSAFFNPMFRCLTSNIDTTKISPQSFFGESNFKGWTNKEFKGYIYILIDEYSRTKLLKFSLNEFIQYQKVKQIILNRKETFLNDEECIAGMDREFYADKIQDLSSVMRGGNKLFLTQRRILKIGCVSPFFEIYSKMIGIAAHHEEVINDELQALFKKNPKKFKEDVNNLVKDLAEHFYRKRKDINGKKAISIGRIENHLLLSEFAFKKDLEDGSVIKGLATKIPTINRLRSLFLLTVADISAVDHGLWNQWKASLLQDLYLKTEKEILNPEDTTSLNKKIQKIQSDVIDLSKSLTKKSLDSFSKITYPNYWLLQHPKMIVFQIENFFDGAKKKNNFDFFIKRLNATKLLEITVVTNDKDHLFIDLISIFISENISVHQARIFTLDDKTVIDTFTVSHNVDYFLTKEEKEVFKTAFEIDQKWIVELGADRTPNISQAQSVNIFIPADVHKKELHQIHFQAWKKGLKSLYYCRSKSIQRAENINAGSSTDVTKNVYSDKEDPNKEDNYEECLSCQ